MCLAQKCHEKMLNSKDSQLNNCIGNINKPMVDEGVSGIESKCSLNNTLNNIVQEACIATAEEGSFNTNNNYDEKSNINNNELSDLNALEVNDPNYWVEKFGVNAYDNMNEDDPNDIVIDSNFSPNSKSPNFFKKNKNIIVWE